MSRAVIRMFDGIQVIDPLAAGDRPEVLLLRANWSAFRRGRVDLHYTDESGVPRVAEFDYDNIIDIEITG
ncbi:MAG TPA: hypothetical protein VK453_25530 [Micromonosporaceae bacterium]|nr:hypothetical protein [Micromonosporaceae bacterium]